MFDQDDQRARLREAQRDAQRRTEEARSEAEQARERMREKVKAFSDFRRREIEAEVRQIMAAALGIDFSQPGWRGWLSFNVKRRIEQELIAGRELGPEEFKPIDLGRSTRGIPTTAQSLEPSAAEALPAAAKHKRGRQAEDGTKQGQQGLF